LRLGDLFQPKTGFAHAFDECFHRNKIIARGVWLQR
jgi:hypothetical protein